MSKFIDLAGQRFSRLTIISRSTNGKYGGARWNVKCDCGNERVASGGGMRAGLIKSCGCILTDDITGKKFNMLTVISQNGYDKWRNATWNVRCDCGNECIVRGLSLKSGGTKSCGCIMIKDLINKRFGKLLVISKSNERNDDCDVMWVTRCDCGNEHVVSSESLSGGSTKSCGCINRQRGKEHWNWNKDKTDEEREIGRNYPEYTDWRTAVHERDSYTCQKCGGKHGELNAHHIDGYAANPELRTTLSNGITLHADEHNDLHHQYGHDVGRENLEKWLNEVNE